VATEADLSVNIDQIGTAPNHEDRIVDTISTTERWSELERVLDEDEKRLLSALRAAWMRDSSLSVREVARQRGWNPDIAEAVLKRIKRKVPK
jgi:hypothetical protein